MADSTHNADQFFYNLMHSEDNNNNTVSHFKEFNDPDQPDVPVLWPSWEAQGLFPMELDNGPTMHRLVTSDKAEQSLDLVQSETALETHVKDDKSVEEIRNELAHLIHTIEKLRITVEEEQKTAASRWKEIMKEQDLVRADHVKLADWTIGIGETMEKFAKATLRRRETNVIGGVEINVPGR